MTPFEWVITVLTIFSVMLIPVLAILVRGAVKWTRTEDRLSELVKDVGELIESKERVHTAMLDQMGRDRQATDRRLRYLEEFWMSTGHGRVRRT